jgi:hypothetical protein
LPPSLRIKKLRLLKMVDDDAYSAIAVAVVDGMAGVECALRLRLTQC